MVKQSPAPVYRIRQFSRLAGVTVRALHHYDRLGLLKPAARSAAGYRLYTDRDIARLEQIVVLKFLGLSLADWPVAEATIAARGHALRRQQRVLAEKRSHLDAAIGAIGSTPHVCDDCYMRTRTRGTRQRSAPLRIQAIQSTS